MTTNFSQFLNVYLAAWPGNVTDPDLSAWHQTFDREVRYNNQKKSSQEMTLNSGASQQLSVSGLAQADWHVLVVRCIGQGYISLSGKDAGGTAITSQVPVYGNAVLPGVAVISTYNLTAAPTIVSQADGSVFEVFEATCVEDGQ